MGIRQRTALADVPITLIQQWQIALAHPGLAARFVDPPAFAVAQIRIGNSPPDGAELERWARPMEYWPASRRAAFPQSPYTPVAVDLERHEALLAQMQAIAGTCDAITQSYVFSALEEGKSADEALAHAHAEVAAMHAIDSEELTAKTDDDWGGLPFVSIDDSGTYTAMQAMFDQLDTEVRSRLVASKNKQPVGEPLTIVLDDYAVIAKECKPVAAQVFKLVARLGRSMRVRLVVLSTTGRVKSLDLEGEGDTLTNFISVELNRQRGAAFMWDEQRYQLDTEHVPSGARQSLAAKQWMPPLAVSSIFEASAHSLAPRRAADMPRAGTRRYELLDELLTPAEQQSSRAHAARLVAFADTEQTEQVFGALQSTEQSTILPGDREALVRFLVRQGWTANDIVKNVKGDSSTLYPLIARLKNEENV